MKSHRTDGVSLTFGLIFLGIVGWWAVAQTLDLDLPNIGWFVAAGLILLGALGLIGALRQSRPKPAPPVADVPLAETSPIVEPTEPDTPNTDNADFPGTPPRSAP